MKEAKWCSCIEGWRRNEMILLHTIWGKGLFISLKPKLVCFIWSLGPSLSQELQPIKRKCYWIGFDFIFIPNFNIGFDIHIIRHQMTQSSYHLIEHFDRICVKFQQLKVVKLDQYFVWHKSLGSIQIYIITTIIGAFLLLYKLK